jgi:hypothetical protein
MHQASFCTVRAIHYIFVTSMQWTMLVDGLVDVFVKTKDTQWRSQQVLQFHNRRSWDSASGVCEVCDV